MQNLYANTLLTIITLFLGAIVVKLYIPAAQRFGVQISPPTLSDIREIRSTTDSNTKQKLAEELRARTPIVWITGGDIDASGSRVDVSNTVEVEGEVSITRQSY